MRLPKCNPMAVGLLWVIVFNYYVQSSYAWFDLNQLVKSASDTLKTTYTYVKDNGYCRYAECCNEVHIEFDIRELQKALDRSLFGQHIASQIIVSAIGGHLRNNDRSEKPLVMSLHGPPGTGKNFVAEHIMQTLYKKGSNSKFVHKYLGRIHFPLQSKVEEYKLKLVNDIKEAVGKCPNSLFIFDEVEKMPSGLFDSIVALLDNHAYTKQLDFRKSIFIFLSNVAGPEIANKLKSLMDNGVWREETKMHDFESTLEIAAYNLVGGLYKSEIIESHVVDHFVPFLPLTLLHVEKCIKAEYAKYAHGEMPKDLLDAIIKEAITFDETGLFSNNGCKRVSKKVEAFHYAAVRKNNRQEL